ncbi:CBO0543 family protein [Aneurinibacillus tyrosinisolvens]|uniref:CBO0543 family protein n=1 Tax=Aneurinibacillus tyrosinisolvens TaxID=1443435 RepID=UPI00069B926A|nr:CBO0543 family protein [Aneurinibacillus tyrosinisolvens]
MFFMLRDLIAWFIWLLIADKERWREIVPVCFFAGFLGATTDNIIHHHPLWTYPSKQPLLPLLGDDWGIYFVVTYLFIQSLPKQHTFWRISLHLFIFANTGLIIEWLHVITNHMTHERWWNYGYSYFANVILYLMFYYFYKIFRLPKLNEK